MEIEALVAKIKVHLYTFLDESGSLLYSSVDTIKIGDLYVLGLNPGGHEAEIKISLRTTIANLPNKKTNSYLDEDWSNARIYEKGQHPLQANVTGLISSLGYDPRDVFCSNLIFTRSESQSGCNYPKSADKCWPVHKEFLKIVDPKCILVFGNSMISPFEYIKKLYTLKATDMIESSHGNWKCLACIGIIEGKERLLIGVPHLSRYFITYHPVVLNWLKSLLRK